MCFWGNMQWKKKCNNGSNNFFVINIFYLFFHTQQHNIHSKQTKQNNRHILHVLKVQTKGRERGWEKTTIMGVIIDTIFIIIYILFHRILKYNFFPYSLLCLPKCINMLLVPVSTCMKSTSFFVTESHILIWNPITFSWDVDLWHNLKIRQI